MGGGEEERKVEDGVCVGGRGGGAVQESEEGLELAPGDVGEAYGGCVGLAGAVDEGALEEVAEVGRVSLEEVAVQTEQCVFDLSNCQHDVRKVIHAMIDALEW